MNQPKDARLLLALLAVTVVLGGTAAWAMLDWARDVAVDYAQSASGVWDAS